MGLLAFIYGSPGVTFQCFKIFDYNNGTRLHRTLFEL